MKKTIYTIIAFSITLLMTGCGSDDKKHTTDNPPAIAVKTSKITVNHTNPSLSVSGKIQATNNADLSTRIMGYVNKVHVNIGDKVNKGQLLVSINNTDLQAKQAQVNAGITEATIAFNNAQKDYLRYLNLFENASASQKEMDDMTANFEMAKARLESANQLKNEINSQFAYSNITAPFSGTITGKNIETGDMANPGVPLISIEAPGAFEVIAMVPEIEISKIKKDAEVTILVKSINQTLKGKVAEVSLSAKHTGGQYLVKIALHKTETPILSGMFASVQFPIEQQTDNNLVLVPTQAIITNGQLSGIYTISQNNTAILRWLRLGKTYGDQVEVLSGLSANESYIISSEGKLFNGAKISVH
ncbi:MAG TPA: efflux RND transporter periplasmic adaptor subunit [Flavobacterium sp.]|nr:efflux RND transporter periplasmic adaptor subunit [Flavobacterium sp.]